VTTLHDAIRQLAFVTNIESPVGGANRCDGALVSPSMDHRGQPGVSRRLQRVAGLLRVGPEVLRRSIATLPPQAPSGLSRERALAILGQLVRVLRDLGRR
jgi:hypothetical protein